MIKFEFSYTLDDMRAFFKDCSAKKALTTLIFVWTVVGLLMFCVLKIISKHIFSDKFFADNLPYFFLAILTVVIVYSTVKTAKDTPKKMFNSYENLYPNGTLIFEFEENSFNHCVSSGETKSENVIEYSRLTKAVESKGYFYIFTAESAAYLIRKSAVIQGTPNELRDILQKHLGDKFTINKKVV